MWVCLVLNSNESVQENELCWYPEWVSLKSLQETSYAFVTAQLQPEKVGSNTQLVSCVGITKSNTQLRPF